MNNPFVDIIEQEGFVLHWKNRHAPMLIMAAVSAAGAIQQGEAAKSEAQSQKNMADYNAALGEREAKAIEQKTQFDMAREAEAGSERMSTLKANLGASGAVSTAGSPLLIMAKQASENELSSLGIGREGSLAAGRARSEGALQTMQGKIYAQKGENAQTAGYMKAGSTALDAFSKGADKGYFSKKSGTGTPKAPKASKYQGTGQSYGYQYGSAIT